MAVGCRRRQKGDTTKQKLVLIVVAACLSLATANAGAKGAEEYWPAENWRTSTPEAQGLSSADLAKAFDYVANEQINVHNLRVFTNSYLILGAFSFPNAREDLHDICSGTKSVSSALVSIAPDEGKIRSVKEKLGELFPDRPL